MKLTGLVIALKSLDFKYFSLYKTVVIKFLINYFTEKKNRVNKDENAPHSPISPVETNKVPNQVKHLF